MFSHRETAARRTFCKACFRHTLYAGKRESVSSPSRI